MNKMFYLLSALMLFCLTFVSGCADTGQQAAKKDGELHIVTSFYPMYIATANITKGVDGVQVTNMTKPQTGCLHDYQLSTDDMKTLENADIFVANGAGMESFMDKIIKEYKNLQVIDASKDIDLLEENGEANPHVWLDVNNAIKQAENISQQLCDADPDHAGAYKANTAVYVGKLKELQAEMNNKLKDISHRDIVTFHEAFPYFAQEFNLNIVKVIEREPGTEPTPQELENIIKDVNRLSAKILFTEPQYSPAAAETIARETGARIYTLDPIVTGEANEQALDAYINTMKQNAQILRDALQ